MKSAEHRFQDGRFLGEAVNFEMFQEQSGSQTTEGQSFKFDNRKFFIPVICFICS